MFISLAVGQVLRLFFIQAFFFLLRLEQIRPRVKVHDEPLPVGFLRVHLGFPSPVRHHRQREMLLHPAASSIPDRAPDLHHDRHHRRRQFPGGGLVLPDAHSLQHHLRLQPHHRQRCDDHDWWRVLSPTPEALGHSDRFCVRRRLSVRGDGGGDNDDDNHGDKASSGCCMAGRYVVQWQRVSTRDRPDQDARLQLRLLHRLRLSRRLVQVSGLGG